MAVVLFGPRCGEAEKLLGNGQAEHKVGPKRPPLACGVVLAGISFARID